MQPNVFRANAPQLYVNMNRTQCMTDGVSLSDAFDTLGVFLGSLYVNDFNRFGRTWQVVAQAEGSFRNRVEEIRRLKVRNIAGGMVPMGIAGRHPRSERAVAHQPLQHVPRRRRQRRFRAGSQFATGHRFDGPARRREPAARDATGMDGHGLPGDSGGQHGDGRFRVFRAGGVSRAGGAVRKLVAAAGRDSRRADVPPQRDLRRDDGARGVRLDQQPTALSDSRRRPGRHQHLHADRLRRPRRPGEQECDFDRRVRQAAARGGRVAARSRPGCLPSAAAADRHDFLRLHSRRRSALGRAGRRGRDAPHPRRRRLQRHVGRDHLRRLSYAGLLLRDRLARRPQHFPEPLGSRRRTGSRSSRC